MSRQVVILKRDDLDPSLDADETLEFTFEGFVYRVDVAASNAARFREFITPFQLAAFEKEKVARGPKMLALESGGTKVSARSEAALPEPVRDSIRAWCKRNKIPVPPKIIGYDLRLAYYDSTGDESVLSGPVLAYREKQERMKIREWSAAQGKPITNGVISASVMEAYNAAHEPAHIQEAREIQGVMSEVFERVNGAKTFQQLGGENAKSLAIPDSAQRQVIRDWARENGYTVGVKGFLSREVQEAYRAAHPKRKARA